MSLKRYEDSFVPALKLAGEIISIQYSLLRTPRRVTWCPWKWHFRRIWPLFGQMQRQQSTGPLFINPTFHASCQIKNNICVHRKEFFLYFKNIQTTGGGVVFIWHFQWSSVVRRKILLRPTSFRSYRLRQYLLQETVTEADSSELLSALHCDWWSVFITLLTITTFQKGGYHNLHFTNGGVATLRA